MNLIRYKHTQPERWFAYHAPYRKTVCFLPFSSFPCCHQCCHESQELMHRHHFASSSRVTPWQAHLLAITEGYANTQKQGPVPWKHWIKITLILRAFTLATSQRKSVCFPHTICTCSFSPSASLIYSHDPISLSMHVTTRLNSHPAMPSSLRRTFKMHFILHRLN